MQFSSHAAGHARHARGRHLQNRSPWRASVVRAGRAAGTATGCSRTSRICSGSSASRSRSADRRFTTGWPVPSCCGARSPAPTPRVTAMPTKRALLIGIDAYPHVPPLNGCVNDVRLMRERARRALRVSAEQITLLADEQATRDGILAAFDALVAATGAGRHRRRSTSPATARRLPIAKATSRAASTARSCRSTRRVRATTCPTSPTTRSICGSRRWRRRRRSRRSIVDACHSGTVTRDDFGERARSIDADARPASELPPSPIPADRRRRARATRARAAGCRSPTSTC